MLKVANHVDHTGLKLPSHIDGLGETLLNKLICGWLLAIAVLFSSLAKAQSDIERETLVALYLIKLAEQVRWPDAEGKNTVNYLVVDDDSDVADRLTALSQQTLVQNKRVTAIHRTAADVRGDFDVIYLAPEFSGNIAPVLTAINDKAILLVTDGSPDQRLVMINLLQKSDTTIGFEINKANILNQGLDTTSSLVLLGGSEIDVAKLYQEGLSVLQQQQSLLDEMQSERSSLEKRLSEEQAWSQFLNEMIEDMNKEVAELREKADVARQELESVSNSLSEQTNKLDSQQTQIDGKNQQIESQQYMLLQLQASISAKEAELAEQVALIDSRSETIAAQDKDIAEKASALLVQEQTILTQRLILFTAIIAIIAFGIMSFFVLRQNKAKQVALQKLESTKEELEKAKMKSELASLSKSNFLSHMSHELRTPLNAILGYAQLLEVSNPSPERLKQDLRTINRSGEHLLSLINDVLDMSKIEAGVIVIKEETFNLNELLQDVIELMKVRADAKGLGLSLTKASELPVAVIADMSKMRQILINLIGNAVKFTEKGEVSLSVDANYDADAALTTLQFQVCDTGIGIPAQLQETIFKPFEQVESSRIANTGQQGTGLGMAITKTFVEAMDGEISLESEVGRGTSFKVKLPVILGELPQEEQEKDKGRVIAIKGRSLPLKVMIVEDKARSAALLDKLLTDTGIETHIAQNGKLAVEAFQTWQPDFIWMDRHMPVMDGIEATKAIRKLPNGEDVKIVALSAAAMEEEKQEVLAVGFDEFVSKPFKLGVVFSVMQRLLNLEYEYDSDALEEETESPALTTVDPAQMAKVGKELRTELANAALQLSKQKVVEVSKKIAKTDAILAKQIAGLAERFEFESLLDIINQVADN
ncbi:MAG: DUF4154 domain-containing protein [Alteromonadaceae bacterium]|nr:DUF4154 domain-containing protein [Alteromonadaceae bacterium]